MDRVIVSVLFAHDASNRVGAVRVTDDATDPHLPRLVAHLVSATLHNRCTIDVYEFLHNNHSLEALNSVGTYRYHPCGVILLYLFYTFFFSYQNLCNV